MPGPPAHALKEDPEPLQLGFPAQEHAPIVGWRRDRHNKGVPRFGARG